MLATKPDLFLTISKLQPIPSQEVETSKFLRPGAPYLTIEITWRRW